jgi:hypothetical protein
MYTTLPRLSLSRYSLLQVERAGVAGDFLAAVTIELSLALAQTQRHEDCNICFGWRPRGLPRAFLQNTSSRSWFY